jgi:hypothetical protein
MGKRLSGIALAVAVMILTGYIAAEATAVITAPKPGDLTPLLVGGLGLFAIAWLLQWDLIVDRIGVLQPARRKIAAAQVEGIGLREQLFGANVPPERVAWGEVEWGAALQDWTNRTTQTLAKCARDLAPLFRMELPRVYQYLNHAPWKSELARSFDWRLERLAEIQRMLE